jgi:hypothetical protein
VLALSAVAAVGGWVLRGLRDSRQDAVAVARCQEAATAAQSRAVVAEGRVQAVLDAFPHGTVLFDGGARPGRPTPPAGRSSAPGTGTPWWKRRLGSWPPR